MENVYADTYCKGKEVDKLTQGQLVSLGKLLASNMVDWGTAPEYESWEWSSEELPFFISKAEELGLIRKRKFHTVTTETIVYDED